MSMLRDTQVAHCLGTDRLRTFVNPRLSISESLRLYEWNAHIAAALFEVLGEVEVISRNSMHRELARWNASLESGGEWFENRHGFLSPRSVASIEQARRRLTQAGISVTADRVVSELPFGFWRFLISRRNQSTLWPFALHRSFPNLPKRGLRVLNPQLRSLHLIRNRIAHHEPIHSFPLSQVHDSCLDVLGYVSTEARLWVAERSRVLAAIADRPDVDA